MKKMIPLFAGLLLCLFSCNNQQTPAETTSETKDENSAAKKNLEATHVVTKAFETGDISMIDSVVASDFVDHSEGKSMNRDSLKAMILAWKADSKDNKSEVIKELADGEYVFSWMRFSGTSSGTIGMPAGPYSMSAIEAIRFRDGKAVEHWSFVDAGEMMKMMAQQAPAGNKTK